MNLLALALLVSLAAGQSPIVKTKEKLTAVLGENLTFTCTTHLKDILQVTWQKLNGQSEDNIATYNEKFGPKVFGSFTDRVSILPSNQQESTLVLSGVRFEDKGCYQCLFTTFPTGSNIGKTCLNVLAKSPNEETQENKTAVISANVNFSCTTQLENIQQVTWKKLSGQSEENIIIFNATLNTFELRNDRATLISRNEQGYTIELSGIKLEDEGCYQCLFNTSEIGSSSRKTCLTVTAHASRFRSQNYFWIILGLLAILIVF
ncbi:nectin-1-like [Pristis pectinata]|uniref:nectin-1-like n=1 Tax=Pristis pectinata TaxID=685728 RepID=UPI00223D7F8C|nr:nectin-1-like [Pristis pectinata]XP_051870628.1 nectin-1-like [Pristis pectinata]